MFPWELLNLNDNIKWMDAEIRGLKKLKALKKYKTLKRNEITDKWSCYSAMFC